MSFRVLQGILVLLSLAPGLNAQDWVDYHYFDGEALTNESFSIWFLPRAAGCTIRRVLDLGDNSKDVSEVVRTNEGQTIRER